uniref:Carboxylic ester hydrolase n=1 Tax=Clastoptera arizonana TaxID=38151 RepID=A0A1B6C6B7_9HEMI
MSDQFVEVTTENGILRGKKLQSTGLTSVPYYAFLGVPYAKPPIGDLRFKAPQPLEPWQGVRDALEDGLSAPQTLFAPGQVQGVEDCLYLNVYTPQHPHQVKSLKPVLFNVHGGGYVGGSGGSKAYPPDNFIDKDVVYVSPTYRVGALGFLSLQNDDISGNAGLKDQVQALIWTKKNIKKFGGDPENITIMGISGGSASVEYLLLSQLATGLFKKAICQSGSSLGMWAMDEDPKGTAIELAKAMGYTGSSEDDKSLYEFFKSCPANDFVLKQNEVFNDRAKNLYRFGFAPCVEKEGKGSKFITRTPRDILENGDFTKVPVIIGYTSREGFIVLMAPMVNDYNLLDKNRQIFIPKNLKVPENKRTEVGNEIVKLYFGDKPVSKESINSLVDLFGDMLFNVGISEATKYLSEKSDKPVYNYIFTKKRPKSTMINLIAAMNPGEDQVLGLEGVPHGGDSEFMYKTAMPNFPPPAEYESDEVPFVKACTTLISTFGKTGNPNCAEIGFRWIPFSSSNPQYFNWGDEFKMVPGRFCEKRLKFWEELYKKYGYVF